VARPPLSLDDADARVSTPAAADRHAENLGLRDRLEKAIAQLPASTACSSPRIICAACKYEELQRRWACRSAPSRRSCIGRNRQLRPCFCSKRPEMTMCDESSMPWSSSRPESSRRTTDGGASDERVRLRVGARGGAASRGAAAPAAGGGGRPPQFTSRTMARIRRARWRNEQMIDWSQRPRWSRSP